MLPDQVSNPGPLTYESGVLPIALHGPAFFVLKSAINGGGGGGGGRGMRYNEGLCAMTCHLTLLHLEQPNSMEFLPF